jgi:cytochrome c553
VQSFPRWKARMPRTRSLQHAAGMQEKSAPRKNSILIHEAGVTRRSWVFMVWIAAMLTSCASPQERHQERLETGSALFAHFCESCHGADARGHGVVAPYLFAKVPDLTMIAIQHGCRFTDSEIFEIIDGQSNDDQFTGKRHMPIWGYELFGNEADDAQAHQRATERINSLVGYLRGIQLSTQCASTNF